VISPGSVDTPFLSSAERERDGIVSVGDVAETIA